MPMYSMESANSPAIPAIAAKAEEHQRWCSPAETAPAGSGTAACKIFPPLAVRDVTTIDSSLSPSKAPATVQTGPPPARPAATPMALPSVDDVFSNKYAQALGGECPRSASQVAGGKRIGVDMMVPPPPGPPGASQQHLPQRWELCQPKYRSQTFPGMSTAVRAAPRKTGEHGRCGWNDWMDEHAAAREYRRRISPTAGIRGISRRFENVQESHQKVLVKADAHGQSGRSAVCLSCVDSSTRSSMAPALSTFSTLTRRPGCFCDHIQQLQERSQGISRGDLLRRLSGFVGTQSSVHHARSQPRRQPYVQVVASQRKCSRRGCPVRNASATSSEACRGLIFGCGLLLHALMQHGEPALDLKANHPRRSPIWRPAASRHPVSFLCCVVPRTTIP